MPPSWKDGLASSVPSPEVGWMPRRSLSPDSILQKEPWAAYHKGLSFASSTKLAVCFCFVLNNSFMTMSCFFNNPIRQNNEAMSGTLQWPGCSLFHYPTDEHEGVRATLTHALQVACSLNYHDCRFYYFQGFAIYLPFTSSYIWKAWFTVPGELHFSS